MDQIDTIKRLSVTHSDDGQALFGNFSQLDFESCFSQEISTLNETGQTRMSITVILLCCFFLTLNNVHDSCYSAEIGPPGQSSAHFRTSQILLRHYLQIFNVIRQQ